ncbi:MAG TPA: TMEM14 family protein [Parachlamydiaceae bacterium]|nr:TMEM14 family protein [Parachlamydiaceae bacterium]
MRPTGWIVLTYALLVFLGGIFGYVKAESTASLIMGVAFAVALSSSAFAMFNEKNIGFIIASISTALLAAFFIYRFALTYSFMPAGMMSVLSLAVLAVLYSRRAKLNIQKQ